MHDRTRDRRNRRTFWIDDRVVDEFAPVMGRYPFGSAALAVYAVLARRADRDGDSWPRLRTIAEQAAMSPRTVQRAIRLLEVLGLVEVAVCYEQGNNRQTTNLYTLLTPPEPVPQIDPDPKDWPPPERRSLIVRAGQRAQSVADAREVERHDVVGERLRLGLPPRQPDTPSPVSVTGPPRQPDNPSPVRETALKGNTNEGGSLKDGAREEQRAGFVVTEVGLSSRQVWAAVLGELGRSGDLGRGDLETWLRPARLIGRDGETLVVGAPNAVARERIRARFVPALRAAIRDTVGVPLGVAVVVDEHGG